MLTDYIQAAMRQAKYEILEDGTYYGEIPPCQGVITNADSLEECREMLLDALETWILYGLKFGDKTVHQKYESFFHSSLSYSALFFAELTQFFSADDTHLKSLALRVNFV